MADKLPFIQLYPGDWLRDPISGCSLEAQALWLRMIFLMHDSDRYGYLAMNGSPIPPEHVARRCGLPREQYETLLAELDRVGVPSRTDDGSIYSRRMVRDEKKRRLCVLAGRKGGNPTLKGADKGGLKARGHKSEVRSQKSEVREETSTPFRPAKPEPPEPKVVIKRETNSPWQKLIDHIHASFTSRKGLPPEWTAQLLARLKSKAGRFEPEGVMALWDLACKRLWHADRSAEADAWNARRWTQEAHSVLFFLDVLSEWLSEDQAGWKSARERYRTAAVGPMPKMPPPPGKRRCGACGTYTVELTTDKKFLKCESCKHIRAVKPTDKIQEEGDERREDGPERQAGRDRAGGQPGAGDPPPRGPGGSHGQDQGPRGETGRGPAQLGPVAGHA